MTPQAQLARKDSRCRTGGACVPRRILDHRNQPAQFACPRCHRIVDEVHRVALANVLAYLECRVCARCVDELRGLASDLELVEVLE